MTDNPYVGPRSIKTGEAFWGRDREIRSLSGLLLAERIVLLHSPSGAGKSSLIEAGLRPRMAERFRVSPLMRVNLELPDELRGMAGLNRYLISTLLSLEEGWPLEQRLPLTELATLSLDAYLEKRALPDDAFENSLLLLDQFEEVLTVSPTDAPAKQQFFEQLGEALQNRRRWALFAIREDYMGGLAPYVRAIPNRLNVPFRLGLLGTQAAKLAIQQPAKDKGVDFTDAAAQKLVDDLSRIHIQQPDGSFISQPGPDVEPVQLQVVCFNLWQHLRDDTSEISAADLSAVGSVDESLAQYYAASLANVAAQTGASERDLRTWFDKHLLTGSPDQPVRGQVRKGAGSTEGLSNAAIDTLVDAHIIRAEPRAGAIWYELAHDRLIHPIRESNLNWFAANLKLFQKQALLWDQQGRGEGLLLRGDELQQTESEAQVLPLTPTESAFLDACRGLRKREKDNLRQRRYIRAGLVASLILLGTSIFFSYFLYTTTVSNHSLLIAAQTAEANANENLIAAQTAEANANEQAKIARAGELASNAVALRDTNLQLSLLLSIEAFHRLDTYQSRGALLDNTRANPQLRQFLNEHTSVYCVRFSPDGKTLASGSADKAIILWDVATGQPLGQPLKGHTSSVSCVAFSPDGKTLASGSADNTIILWDVATGQPIGQPLKGHTNQVNSVAFSPDGKTLASGSDDSTIILWDVATSQPLGQPLKGHTDHVTSVAFSPDGKTLASGSADKIIILWDMATSQPLGQPLRGHTNQVNSVAFSPDGKTLASGSSDNAIILWNVASGQPVGQPLKGHTSFVESVAFSPDGKTLASGSLDNTVIRWDVATGQPIGQPLKGHTDFVESVAFSPDGKMLASGGGNTIILWDISAVLNIGVSTRQPIGQQLKGHTNFVNSVAFSPDGKTLASGSSDNTIILWDMATGQPIGQPLKWHTNYVNSVAFSPDGKTLASGSNDKTIILWDVATGQPIGKPLKGHTDFVESVAFSPDGKMLASGGGNTIILWDVSTGRRLRWYISLAKSVRFSPPQNCFIVFGPTSVAKSVAFSSDGKTLASGRLDKTIILWDVLTGQRLDQPLGQPFKGDTFYITSVAFSPDGKTLASGSADSTIILWNVSMGQPIGQPLKGHTDHVTSVAFSPDGKTLVSGSNDKTIILWDVATGQPVGQPLKGHTNFVNSVAFSPTGKTLASGSNDSTIILWNVDSRSWVEKNCERANRNLTRTEWDTYFPNETYRATCPQFGLEAEATAVPMP